MRALFTLVLLAITLSGFAQGPDTTVSISQQLSTLSLCPGDTIHVHYTVSRKFLAGNTFTLELSNSSGSFSSPLAIGAYASDTNGMIIGTIPSNATAGNGYRVRILSTSPIRTSPNNGADFTIRPFPVIAPSSNNPVCEGNNLQLNAGHTGSASIVWTGPGGYNDIGNGVTRSPATMGMAGAYTVEATLNGCTIQQNINVTIKPKPTPILTTNSPVCLGDTMKFNFSGAPGAIYELTLPDASSYDSIQYLIVHQAVFKYAGTCTLKAMQDGCSATVYSNFTVKFLPDTPVIISNSPLCVGANIQFYALLGGSPSATYEWSGPAGFSSAAPTPSVLNISHANAGIYMLRSKFNGCYSVPAYDTVTILDKPEKPVGGSNSPLCEGDGMQLTVQDVPGATYLWIGPNNFKSNIQNPLLNNASALATGYYIIQDSISGCTNADTIYVEVNAYPQKPHILTNAPLCPVDTLMLKAVSNIQGIQYKWASQQNTTDTGETIIKYPVSASDTGWHTVLADNGGCTTQGDTAYVSLKPMPAIPGIIHNSPLWEGQELQLTTNSNETGIVSYWVGPNNWADSGDNVTISNVSKNHIGTYILTIDKNGCKASNIASIDVRDFISRYDFALYPSPNNGKFTISGKLNSDQSIDARILNSAGQEVYKIRLQSDKKFILHHFDLKDRLSSGIYFLQITHNGHLLRIPFTVVR